MGSTTGPAIYPGSSTFPGSSTYPGQGERPLLWCLYSTDDVSDPTPSWQYADQKVRSFSTSRGRESELDEIPAGTATIALDNRTRTFDPVADSTIRPGNQWWLRAQFCGETHDLFKGYAEAYDQTWPAKVDAVAVVHCADEFKRLNLELLPTMDPPRDTYGDVVQFDNPALYWHLHDDPATLEWKAVVGSSLGAAAAGTYTGVTPGAIKGDNAEPYQAIELPTGSFLRHSTTADDPEDLSGLVGATIETWFRKSANPGSTQAVVTCPYSSGPQITFQLEINSSGQIVASARNSGGTITTATSAALVNDTWYHLVATVDGTNLTLYVNGAQAAQAAHTGTFATTLDTTPVFDLGDSAAGITMRFDETALYRYGLTSARVLAHYTAGTARGLDALPLATAIAAFRRILSIFDAINNHAPLTNPHPAAQMGLQGVFMHGQNALLEMRAARDAENIDAMMFIGKAGQVVYLGHGHRSFSPWNTAQATYGDAGGSELPYLALVADHSDAFLYNYVTVTREGGLTQTASDTTSINRYGKRSLSISNIDASDTRSQAVADLLLLKYKDPFTRITSIAPKMQNTATASATFARELGDKVRILSTPPGGGSRIDQSPWIQKIELSGERGKIWYCRLGVSPL